MANMDQGEKLKIQKKNGDGVAIIKMVFSKSEVGKNITELETFLFNCQYYC